MLLRIEFSSLGFLLLPPAPIGMVHPLGFLSAVGQSTAGRHWQGLAAGVLRIFVLAVVLVVLRVVVLRIVLVVVLGIVLAILVLARHWQFTSLDLFTSIPMDRYLSPEIHC